MIDVIEPCNLIRISEGKITSIASDESKLYIGLNNGDLLVYSKTQDNSAKEGETEVKGEVLAKIKSYNDVKGLFEDNDHSKMFQLVGTFKNISQDGSSINSIYVMKMSGETKSIIVVGTETNLCIFEIIGCHINQIFKLDETRRINCVLYIDFTRLLYIGIGKKVLIFKIINKTRNLFSFVKSKVVIMKDRIKTINKFGEDVLVGLISEYWIINSQFDTNQLITEDSIFTHSSSSFSYFGLSSSPHLWTIPRQDNMLLIRDTQVVNIESDLKMTISPIKLTSVPLTIIDINPLYLVVVYSKRLEIIDIETGDVIQKFTHQINSNQIFITINNSIISLGSNNNDVLQFDIVSYNRQLEQYLSNPDIPELTKAISLVSKIPYDAIFIDEREKIMKLRQLYTLKAKVLFNSYSKYHESLVEIASEWFVSFHDILSLFPDFLNGEVYLFPGSVSNEDTLIRRVTVDDLRSMVSIESENDTDTASRRPVTTKTSITIRKFYKAVNNLIIYLTDQRRILTKFQNNPNIIWKGITITPRDIYPVQHDTIKYTQLEEVATIIDTCLFLCYFYCKPMLLGPLLRLPSNHCDSNVVNKVLQNVGTSGFIKELLDFYFGRHLHDDALGMLYKLAQEENSGPELTIQYLQKLTGDELKIVFKYTDWILQECEDKEANVRLIFMNDSYQCESYDLNQVFNYLLSKDSELAIVYLQWLLFESDYDISGKQLNKFETKLAGLYLDQLKTSIDEEDSKFYQLENYTKLYNLLKTSTHYDPWKILKQIPTTQDKFLRLVIFIYKRLEEHEKSIDVLFNQLNDLPAAMNYANDIYTRNEPIGCKLFHKLLEDLLMNYTENIEQITQLVTLHGTKMSISKVLTQLPDSFPIYKLTQFLEYTISNNNESLVNTRIKAQLYKVGAINMEDKVLTIQSESYKISSSKQPCAVCNKRLGYAVFGVTRDNQIVHYGCIQRQV